MRVVGALACLCALARKPSSLGWAFAPGEHVQGATKLAALADGLAFQATWGAPTVSRLRERLGAAS
jgi:hypothetical protein